MSSPSFWLAMSAPATTALWPERYFEAECTTTSIPSAMGRWKMGVAHELSTMVTTPRSRATAAHARRSCSSNNKLVGDSRRSEEHTSELQSRPHLVCRLLLEKKKKR